MDDEPMAMDSAPEQAMPWLQEKLPIGDWCLLIVGQREDSGKMNWERWASGLSTIELTGVLEDVKLATWLDHNSND